MVDNGVIGRKRKSLELWMNVINVQQDLYTRCGVSYGQDMLLHMCANLYVRYTRPLMSYSAPKHNQ